MIPYIHAFKIGENVKGRERWRERGGERERERLRDGETELERERKRDRECDETNTQVSSLSPDQIKI